MDYVSDILTRFAQTRALYGVQDSAGKPLEYIVDMLEAWRQAQGGDGGSSSPSRERFVSLHLGEYTLFMSGLFRERLKTRGQLDYYMAHGSSAFWRCAGYEINPARQHLFRHLYFNFGKISNTLDYMRREQFPLKASADNMLMAFWRV